MNKNIKKQICEIITDINDPNYLEYLLILVEATYFDYLTIHQSQTQQSACSERISSDTY